jgi:CSLREA domain-containing protein
MRSTLAAVVILAFVLVTPAAALAATFVVNTIADSADATPGDGFCGDSNGACSLRAAVMEANELPGADSIILPAGTFELTQADDPEVLEDEDFGLSGDLDLLDDVTITGAGAGQSIIDGFGLDRVFWVAGVVVELRQITIRAGSRSRRAPASSTNRAT